MILLSTADRPRVKPPTSAYHLDKSSTYMHPPITSCLLSLFLFLIGELNHVAVPGLVEVSSLHVTRMAFHG